MTIKLDQNYPQFFELNGVALNDGYIYIGTDGLDPISNPKQVYLDANLTIPIAQPLRTTGGYIYYNGNLVNIYISGAYSITVKNSLSEIIYTKLSATVFSLNSIDNIASLKNINGSNASSVEVLGYYVSGDGGGGTFYWDSTSTEIDNGGTIIQATGITTGRWKRVYSGVVNVKWFGAKGDGVTDDTIAIQNILNSFSGNENTGYGSNPYIVDLCELSIKFINTLIIPINISFVNGTLYSQNGKIVFRNPYIANTSIRGYTEYWKYMKTNNKNINFDCLVIINTYIGAEFENCLFRGLVFVNSNTLWTEHNIFNSCSFSENVSAGGCIRFDGNKSGNSIFSTGSGVGASDGSFGYNMFDNCKIDSNAPQVGISLVDGATLYNAGIGFRGYTRGNSPAGAFLYIDSSLNVSSLNFCNFNVSLESFGASANVISLSTNSRFWYNMGTIKSASPEMTMSQDSVVDIRSNNINVIGVVLYDSSNAEVFNGASYQTLLTSDLKKRQWIKPKFSAYATSNQTFSSNVNTKINFASEEYDVGGFYTSNRFTPKVAGYYQVNARVSYDVTATVLAASVTLYKNGSAYRIGNYDTPTNDCAKVISSLVYLNGSTDYIEVYGYVFDNSAAPIAKAGIAETYFNASFVDY